MGSPGKGRGWARAGVNHLHEPPSAPEVMKMLSAFAIQLGRRACALPLPGVAQLLVLPGTGSGGVSEGERVRGPGKLKPAEKC